MRCDVRIFRDESKDDIGSLAQVEVVAAGGERLAPYGDGKSLACRSNAVREQNIPLFGGRRDVERFVDRCRSDVATMRLMMRMGLRASFW